MTDTKEPPIVLEGTPLEVGQQLFEKRVLPALRACNNQPPRHVEHFYAGLLMSLMGAMAADFGHQRALHVVQVLVASFEGMGAELPGSRTN